MIAAEKEETVEMIWKEEEDHKQKTFALIVEKVVTGKQSLINIHAISYFLEFYFNIPKCSID